MKEGLKRGVLCCSFSVIFGVERTVKNYYPLNLGAYWEYEEEWIGEKSVKGKYCEAIVNSFVSSDGYRIYEFKTVREIARSSGVKYAYYAVEIATNNTIAVHGYETYSFESALEEPLKIGTKWKGLTQRLHKIVAVNETVTVKAGTFTNCVKVASYNPGKTKPFYYTIYAPGMGMVKSYSTKGAVLSVNKELVSYKAGIKNDK